MRVRTRPAGRAGFTLVELMIVITIIAVLASLLLGAVQKVKSVGQRTKAVAEISQLDTAIATFKTGRGGVNPPQFIHFPPVPSQTETLTTDQQVAIRILQGMFRAYDRNDPIPFKPDGVNGYTDLRNDGTGKGVKLTGSQCLTFFLAGPQLQGFQQNKPLHPTGTGQKPYIDVQLSQLQDPEDPTSADKFSLRDVWGTPYAYFSSGASDGYAASNPGNPANPSAAPRDGFEIFKIADRSPDRFIGPFRTATNKKWMNPGRVQIISAGPDKVFGTAFEVKSPVADSGNFWTPGTGDYADAGVGADDIANFNGGAPLSVSGK